MNDRVIFWAILGALLLGGGIVVMTEPRGIRNNNPGNIRHGSSRWQGMSADQSDPEYVSFIAPEWGIRALAKLLRNYQLNYGLDTIAQIIARWAPSNENDTQSYIESVSRQMNFTPTYVPLNLKNTQTLNNLVRAIIYHENGKQPYSDELIAKGIALSL